MSDKPIKCDDCGASGVKMMQTDDAFECYDCIRKKIVNQDAIRFAKNHGYAMTKIDTSSDAKEIGKHYGYDYRGVRLDPYRIFSVYRISHPAQQHAIKKLLRAGESVKSLDDDIAEAIATLQRWQQMRAEDEA